MFEGFTTLKQQLFPCLGQNRGGSVIISNLKRSILHSSQGIDKYSSQFNKQYGIITFILKVTFVRIAHN